jgi:IS1 transposase
MLAVIQYRKSQVYCTDKWATYASVIPQDKLVQSKATTHDIERNHCRQRHWFGRFKRKSIIVSKSNHYLVETHCDLIGVGFAIVLPFGLDQKKAHSWREALSKGVRLRVIRSARVCLPLTLAWLDVLSRR